MAKKAKRPQGGEKVVPVPDPAWIKFLGEHPTGRKIVQDYVELVHLIAPGPLR